MHVPFEECLFKSFPGGSVTQFFGENPNLYKTVCPTTNLCLTAHNGLDLVAPWGTPIFCVETGIVVEVKDSPTGYGKHVRILAGDHEWTYGHLSRIDVAIGRQIREGEQVGLMGNTGFVVSGATPYWKHNPYAGTHLHLGLRIFKEYSGQGQWTIAYSSGHKGDILNYNNGFLGSVDPLPLFEEHESFGEPFEGAIRDTKPENRLTVISILNHIRRTWGVL